MLKCAGDCLCCLQRDHMPAPTGQGGGGRLSGRGEPSPHFGGGRPSLGRPSGGSRGRLGSQHASQRTHQPPYVDMGAEEEDDGAQGYGYGAVAPHHHSQQQSGVGPVRIMPTMPTGMLELLAAAITAASPHEVHFVAGLRGVSPAPG